MKLRIARKILNTPWPVRLMVYDRNQQRRACLVVMRWQTRGPEFQERMQTAFDKVRVAVAKAKLEAT